MRSLEKVWARSRSLNRRFPREFLGFLLQSVLSLIFTSSQPYWIRLWIQSDNTVKELRNQYGARVLASLAQAGVFSSTCEAHLRVGHTHEDIDACFSIIASYLRTAANLQTPHDLLRKVDEKLRPIFEGKNMAFGVELVRSVLGRPNHFVFPSKRGLSCNMWGYCWHYLHFVHAKVRDWVAIMPDVVTFKNAYRARKLSLEDAEPRKPLPQMFTFMPRAGEKLEVFLFATDCKYMAFSMQTSSQCRNAWPWSTSCTQREVPTSLETRPRWLGWHFLHGQSHNGLGLSQPRPFAGVSSCSFTAFWKVSSRLQQLNLPTANLQDWKREVGRDPCDPASFDAGLPAVDKDNFMVWGLASKPSTRTKTWGCATAEFLDESISLARRC